MQLKIPWKETDWLFSPFFFLLARVEALQAWSTLFSDPTHLDYCGLRVSVWECIKKSFEPGISCNKMKICLRKWKKDRPLVQPAGLVDCLILEVSQALPAWPCSNLCIHLWMQTKRMFSWVSSIPSCVFQWSQAVAGGGSSAGDVLFGPVVLFSG